MAKHDVDPVLRQLVRAVNESGQAAVPVTVHGTTLTGTLIVRSRYFSELAAGNPPERILTWRFPSAPGRDVGSS